MHTLLLIFHLELHSAFVSARNLPHEDVAYLVIAQRQRKIQLRVFFLSLITRVFMLLLLALRISLAF